MSPTRAFGLRMVLRAPAIAGALLAGAAFAGPSARATPEAADKGLGMALMSASVASNGDVVHASGVTDVEALGDGDYILTFARPLDSCTFVVSASNQSGESVGRYTALGKQLDDRRIGVSILVDATPVNRPFAVMTFCTR